MKAKHKTLILFTVICITFLENTYSQNSKPDTINRYFNQIKKVGIMIDGGVKSTIGTKNSNDMASSGIIGFKYDDQRNSLKLSISALSSFDSLISNSNIDYAKNILNTGITKPGLASISFDYHNRFIFNEGFLYFLSHSILQSKGEDIAIHKKIKDILQDNRIDSLNFIEKHLGYKIYGEIANSIWCHSLLESPTNVSVASLGVGFTLYNQLLYNKSYDLSLYYGIGLTSRIIFNDISQSKYKEERKDILGSDKLLYLGPEIFLEIDYNNLYAKFNLPILLGKDYVEGLMRGQPLFAVGIKADFSYVEDRKFEYIDRKNNN